jgi:hypothetical protein
MRSCRSCLLATTRDALTRQQLRCAPSRRPLRTASCLRCVVRPRDPTALPCHDSSSALSCRRCSALAVRRPVIHVSSSFLLSILALAGVGSRSGFPSPVALAAHVSPRQPAPLRAQKGTGRAGASDRLLRTCAPLFPPSLPFPSPFPSSVAQPFSCFLCGLCCAAARAAGAGGAERSRAAQRHAAGERREKGKGQARQRGAASLGHCGHLRAPHALPAHLFFVAICARSATSSARAAL